MDGPGVTDRRGVLRGLLVGGLVVGGLGAGALAGCGQTDAEPGSTTGPDPSAPAPDIVRRDVAASEQALIAAYDTALAAFPALGADLTGIREQHAAHLAAMGAEAPAPAAGSPSPAAASPAAAIALLRAAEQQAARARRTSCVAAGDAELARTLALIAASEQSHAAALRGLAAAAEPGGAA